MRWPRRTKKPEPSPGQLLRAALNGMTINHQHTVTQEPVPPPVAGEVVIRRQDGSDAWRGHIYCGRSALTMLDVPLVNIDPKFSPAAFMRLEFRWER